MEAKLIDIGNSKGIRIPKKVIQKYHLGNKIDLEETRDGLLIRAKYADEYKLSWEETFKAQATEKEDWTDLNTSLSDGLDTL